MKQIKFYLILVLLIVILIIAFANIGNQSDLLLLITGFTVPLTIPILGSTLFGIILGWIIKSYLQDVKNQTQQEEYEAESGAAPEDDSDEKSDDVIEE